MIAFLKQILVILLLVVVGVLVWGARDPAARDKILAFGIPPQLLPVQAFLAAGSPNADPAGLVPTPGGDASAGGGKGNWSGKGDGSAKDADQASGKPASGGDGQSAVKGPGGAKGFGGGRDSGPALVVTAAVATATTNDRASAIGTAEAIRSVTLYPRASGLVTASHLQAGAHVGEGAVLLQLDDAAERLALDAADIKLKDAATQLDRTAKLAANKSIAAVTLETAQSALDSAGIDKKVAELALDQRQIRAPFAGYLGLTTIQEGSTVTPTTVLATLDDRSTLNISFRIPEAFAAKVSLGQKVEAGTVSRPGETFTATVTALGSQIEPDSRTLVVQATLDNTDDRLRPGMSFFLTLHFTGETALAVPSLALQWDRDGSYVWRVEAGKVQRVAAGIIERNAESVLIRGDLAIGDEVVVEGLQRLRPDAPVKVASPGGQG